MKPNYAPLRHKIVYFALTGLSLSILLLLPPQGYGESQDTKGPNSPDSFSKPSSVPSSGEPAPAPSLPPSGNTPIEQTGPDEYRIGKLMLNKKTREIAITGQVNMQSGLVEYLACCSAEAGKLHESVLKLDTKPSDVQVALLLLGAKAENNLKFQGDPNPPKGDPLEIWVEWELQDKTKKKVRGEELVYNQAEKKPMGKTTWAFTGSFIREGRFVADMEGSIIATFRDPAALINNSLPVGADDTQIFSNENLLPPVGTKVTLFIKPVPNHSPEKHSL
ncbi:MAG: YdjY domain-containing protein [bacterium]